MYMFREKKMLQTPSTNSFSTDCENAIPFSQLYYTTPIGPPE